MFRTAILLAAGKSQRMQGITEDKILHPLCGQPTFLYALNAFLKSELIHHWIVVYRDAEQQRILQNLADRIGIKPIQWVQGGSERQISVLNALEATPQATDCVFIHDCARPLVQPAHIQKLSAQAEATGAAVLVHRIYDTVRRMHETQPLLPLHLETIDRSGLLAMETPQVFHYQDILEAYRRCQEKNILLTDDVAAWLSTKKPIGIVENFLPNPKLTTSMDLKLVELFIQSNLYDTF